MTTSGTPIIPTSTPAIQSVINLGQQSLASAITAPISSTQAAQPAQPAQPLPGLKTLASVTLVAGHTKLYEDTTVLTGAHFDAYYRSVTFYHEPGTKKFSREPIDGYIPYHGFMHLNAAGDAFFHTTMREPVIHYLIARLGNLQTMTSPTLTTLDIDETVGSKTSIALGFCSCNQDYLSRLVATILSNAWSVNSPKDRSKFCSIMTLLFSSVIKRLRDQLHRFGSTCPEHVFTHSHAISGSTSDTQQIFHFLLIYMISGVKAGGDTIEPKTVEAFQKRCEKLTAMADIKVTFKPNHGQISMFSNMYTYIPEIRKLIFTDMIEHKINDTLLWVYVQAKLICRYDGAKILKSAYDFAITDSSELLANEAVSNEGILAIETWNKYTQIPNHEYGRALGLNMDDYAGSAYPNICKILLTLDETAANRPGIQKNSATSRLTTATIKELGTKFLVHGGGKSKLMTYRGLEPKNTKTAMEEIKEVLALVGLGSKS